MRTALLRAAMVLAALVLATAFALPGAQAQSLDAARAAGQIGEAATGYVVLRQPNAPAAVRRLVDSVNAQRRQIYAKRAREQGVPPDQVGLLYAGQIAARAPKGTWLQDSNGNWRRK